MMMMFLTATIMLSNINNSFLVQVPTHGGELREGAVGLPHTINPVLAVTDIDRDISSLVYSGLMKYNKGSVTPDVASSYTISDDGLTYTFTIRPKVKFQDGTPLTADDVAFTIQKIQDPALKSPRRVDWMDVAVKVTSPNTIELTLKQPYAPFLVNTTVGILPKHIWNSLNDDQFSLSDYNLKPVGAGPYEIGSISRTAGIPTIYSLSTWNGYFGKIPYISTLSFNFFADKDKALSALDAGTIDSVASISSTDASRLASDSAQSYKILSTSLPRIFGVFLNQNQAPALADKNVRMALDMSVDREDLIKTILNGYGLPIQGPLPIGMSTTSSVEKHADIATAQGLLEKNGWKKNSAGIYEKSDKKNIMPLAFDIYTADTPDLKQAADLVMNSWKKLGAQVNLKVFEPSDLYQNIIRTRKYDALLFGELIGKDRDLYAFWHSSQRNSPGLNVAMYANTKADKLLTDIRSTMDFDTRASKYADFDNIIRSDIPAIFLYVPDFIYVVPKALHGISLDTVTVPSDRWGSIADWYISTENVWKIFTKK